MLKKMTVGLVGAATVAATMAQAAELKVGFVNGQRIVNESPQAAKAKKKLDKDFEPRDKELQQMAKRLQSMQENFEKNGPTMSESDRRNKERDFNDLNRDFQRKQREFREDLNLRQNEEMSAIYERVNKAIRQIAETEKYDIIFQEAVYAGPRIDITEKVIKALGDGSK